MTTYYINPDHTNNGDGTSTAAASGAGLPGAYNTWSITYIAGNTYLGKGGTEWASSTTYLGFSFVGDLTIGAYDLHLGRPIIDCALVTSANRGIRIPGNNCTFQDLHVKGPTTGTGGYADCFTIASGISNTTIQRCTIEGQVVSAVEGMAISSYGTLPVTFKDNDMFGSARGIQHQGDPNTNVTAAETSIISGNYIHDLVFWNDTQAESSDCIHFSALTSVINANYYVIIENNTLSDWGENGIDVAAANKVIIRYNDVGPCHRTDQYSLGNSALLLGNSAGTGGDSQLVYGNYIHDISHPTENAAAIAPRGGHNCKVFNNIFKNCQKVWSSFNGAGLDNQFYNNVVDGIDGGNGTNWVFRVNVSPCTLECKNNIYINITSDYLYYSSVTGTEIQYGNECTEEAYSSIGTGSLVDLGGNITADPKLTDKYGLMSTSPCIGTGAIPYSNIDYTGAYRRAIDYDIGARWFNAHEDSTT